MSGGPLLTAPAHAQATPSEDAAIARIVARLSSEYVLRGFLLVTDIYGDIRLGLLVQAINAANIAHLQTRTEEAWLAVSPGGTFPDDLRRPISIARLAESAGLPFESTRRLVQRLVDFGACRRVDAGVIVPRAAIERPEAVRAVIANVGYVRKFMRDLQGVGVVEGALTSGEPDDQDGPGARLVERLATDYVLRALQLLVATYGDIRSAVVAQTIVAANTAHLDTRAGDGWRYAGIDQPPPDEVRRPISIARLAESLGVPYETLRRQVGRLLAAGVCARVENGVIVPGGALERDDCVGAMLANLAYVRKFARDLQAAWP